MKKKMLMIVSILALLLVAACVQQPIIVDDTPPAQSIGPPGYEDEVLDDVTGSLIGEGEEVTLEELL
jgi:uncharacterized lipoprotein YajG